MSCVALAFCTRACALATWTARLCGSHWLIARLLIGWLFMHDLEERCSVHASLRTCEPTHRKRLAAGVLTILWAIDRYSLVVSWIEAYLPVRGSRVRVGDELSGTTPPMLLIH